MTTLEERPAPAEIGQPRRRKEDAHLITGRTVWTDNITLPGLQHLAILRSPMAHARITSINTTAATGRPGVVAVFTGRDFAETQGSIPCAWPVTADIVNPGHPSIAVDQVNHVGEAVAIVVARDKSAAQDALEAIDVDYEPLPVVLDMEAALADGAPLVHPNTESNRCFTWAFESGAAGTGQPIEDVLKAAEVTVKRRFIQQRLIPAFMEPRSTVAQPDGDGVTLWSSTQIPHVLRTMLALSLGIPEQKVRVIAPDVGGGFGGKLQVTPEEFICTLVARRLGKPVKYTESRSESLMSGHHGRDQIQDITLTARRDGTFTGLDVHILSNMGAYLRLITPGIPLLGAFMFNGSYKFDAYRFVCDGVFTTKTPTDAYRGAGRPEATFAIERIIDEMAVELGMDPMELRRKNWIKHEEFPFTTITGITYDSGNYEAATDKALELMGWDELRREQADRIEREDPVRLGLGISTYHRDVRLAPSRVLGVARATPPAGGTTPRSGCSPPARSRSSPARARTVRGTRRRGARSSPTGSACRSRTSRSCTATRSPRRGAGHLRLAFAGRRGDRGVECGPRGGRQGQADRRAHAGGQRGRPRVRERRVQRQGRPRHRQDHPGHRLRGVRRRTTCPTASSPTWTPTRRSTRWRSRSRTARTCARSTSTPRPGSRRSASTSASTTSARRSTR